MTFDYYCLDADNRESIFPVSEKVQSYSPNTAFHQALVTCVESTDGRYVLSVAIHHGCEVCRKVLESSLTVDSCPDAMQLCQLGYAWTLCHYITGHYRKRPFHRLFFSLVLRDAWSRSVFAEWIRGSERSKYVIVPNLIASGPVAAERI